MGNDPVTPDIEQIRAWALLARRQADEGTTEFPRELHIAIAEEYDARAGPADRAMAPSSRP
jgi:hypothetical protein